MYLTQPVLWLVVMFCMLPCHLFAQTLPFGISLPLAQFCHLPQPGRLGRPGRHLLPASEYRHEMGQRFHTWQDITSLSTVA